jgi:hypothetical protein
VDECEPLDAGPIRAHVGFNKFAGGVEVEGLMAPVAGAYTRCKAQLEDLRELIAPVRAQLEHLRTTPTG